MSSVPLLAVCVLPLALVAVACGRQRVTLAVSAGAVPSQTVQAARPTVLVVLRSATRIASELEQTESLAIADGTMPPEADVPFHQLMRAYSNAVATAVAQLATGRVREWPELKTILDPVVAQLQRLADLIETSTPTRSAVWRWFETLRDVLIDGLNLAVGQPLFGVPLFPLVGGTR